MIIQSGKKMHMPQLPSCRDMCKNYELIWSLYFLEDQHVFSQDLDDAPVITLWNGFLGLYTYKQAGSFNTWRVSAIALLFSFNHCHVLKPVDLTIKKTKKTLAMITLDYFYWVNIDLIYLETMPIPNPMCTLD